MGNPDFLSIHHFTRFWVHVPVLESRILYVVCPVSKLRVGIGDAGGLCRPLPFAGDDNAVRVLALFGNADGIVIAFIDALHICCNPGTEDERTGLEVEPILLYMSNKS